MEQDLDKIREYYQNHGFIDVQVKDVRKDRTEKMPMIITIVIVEGPQYHVRKLTITGYEHSPDVKIRAFLKMKEGSVYSPKQLRDDAKAVLLTCTAAAATLIWSSHTEHTNRRALQRRGGCPLVCGTGSWNIRGNTRNVV